MPETPAHTNRGLSFGPSWRIGLSLIILLCVIAPALHGQLSSQTGDSAQSPLDSLTGASSADCADPLMASSSQCAGVMKQGMDPQTTSPLGLPAGTQAALAAQYGLGSAQASNYSDVEQLAQQPDARGPQAAPPEPLTEFQTFIASTTGQILPVYGVDLFRRVPTTFAPVDMAPVPPDYVIGPGDELRIRVWGQVNTQSNVRVDRAGDIYLPQVGPIHVAGLPYSGLEAHIRDALSRVYKNFELTADVGQIRSIQIYITGEARRPGLYTVSSLSTLVNALFSSGGPSVQGSMRRIELRRNGNVVTTFDLYGLLRNGDKSKDVALFDGDVVYIPPVGPQAAITGSIRMPAIYELDEGEKLGDLVHDAGGATAVSSGARISIERIEDRRDRQAMEVTDDEVGLASSVRDGDLVRVYSIVPLYQKTVTLRGNIANPGRFAWHEGMRVSELIPDKQSLLTRNYWWRRAQLGMPAPEFQPMQALTYLHQPSENVPVEIPPSVLEKQRGTGGAQETQGDAAQPTLPAAQAQSPQAQAAMMQTQAGSRQGQNLTAEQRASNETLAAGQTNVSTDTRPAEQPLDIRLPAPEIDWDYAVIERTDPETLKTELIPFDLGKLVLRHDASQDLELEPGDAVTIFSEADVRVPVAEQTKLVRLEGEFVHAGVYTVHPHETLRQLVERAGGFTPNAYLFGSEFTRESTRAIQQARIDEYVQQMNLSIQRGTLALVTAPAATPQDLASSAAAASLERELLASLKQIRATGRIVLQFKPGSSGADSVPNVGMEDGDRFVVPPMPASVSVVGAVYNQNAFLYTDGLRAGEYLRMAGGLNKNADRKHRFVIRANGEVISYDMAGGPWGNQFDELPMNPGDAIVVPDKTLKPSLMRGVLDWSQLFSQFALGAAALTIIAP
jgi:protein involved in polysaccharide export with SLBB domain